MKSTPLTIEELFSSPFRYTVPLFQRKYSWHKERHWKPLWEDIQHQAESYLEDSNKKTNHFLGSVILNLKQTFEKGHPQAEIIDGQQRLTTLQIFLCALKNVAKKEKIQYVIDQTTQLTENKIYDGQEQEQRFKIWPTNADRKQFKEIINDEASEGAMQDAYNFFNGAIETFISSPDNKEKNLMAIIEVMRRFLKLIKVELENEDDPQIIFETLNARGQPLLASDLIKNYIFMRIFKENKLDAEDLYQKYWEEFDKNSDWNKEETQGRLTRHRIDLFMFHYLTMKTSKKHSSKPIKVEHLYQEFKEWYEKDYKENPEGFLKDLSKYRNHYIKLIKPEGETRFDQFARRLKGLDTATPYPVLLYLIDLLSEGSLTSEQMDQISTYLESWLVRRVFNRYTSQGYNRFFIDLLNKLKENPQNLEKCVLEELTQTTTTTRKWPNDEEFKEAWLNQPIYQKNPSRCLMFLEALNEALYNGKTERIILDGKKISIEHLLPQKAGQDLYPYHPTPSLKREGENEKDFRERIIHTIGNLTLITPSLNSSISNGPFDKKVEEIKKHSILLLNNELKAEESYSEKSIEERGKKLFETALKIWPRPKSELENIVATIKSQS